MLESIFRKTYRLFLLHRLNGHPRRVFALLTADAQFELISSSRLLVSEFDAIFVRPSLEDFAMLESQ